MDKKWKSCAEWQNFPISYDKHYTKEQAECVCKMLQRDGMGGEGKEFPIRTWIEKIK